MTNTVSYLLFHRICRFCLKVTSESGELLPLFGTNQSDYGRFTKDSKESLPEIISSCIGLNVDEHDGLPVNICSACVDKLKASNSFRNLCLQSANTLQEIKLQHQYEQMGYESDDDEPLHLLKPPVMVFVDGIKSECDLNEGNLYNMDEHRGIESDKNDDNDSDYNDNNNDDNNDDDDDTDTDDSLINEIKQKKYGKKAVKRKAPSSSSSSTSPKSKIIPILPPKHKPTTTTTKITSLTITPFTKPSATSTAAAASKSNKQSTATSATTTTTTSSNNSIEPQSTDATQQSEIKEKPQKSRLKMPKQCTVCGLIVKRLRDHMKMHPEALEFKCQHCSRTYLTQNGLDRHLDTQHTERRAFEEYFQSTILSTSTTTTPLPPPPPRPSSTASSSSLIPSPPAAAAAAATITTTTTKTIEPSKLTRTEMKRIIERKKRLTGKDYISEKGIPMLGKQMRPPCPHTCRMGCNTRITQEQRFKLFTEFYALGDNHLKWEYLAQLVGFIKPKKRYPRGKKVIRNLNIAYNLMIDGSAVRVCRVMFVNTFCIAEHVVQTAMKKCDENGKLIVGDLRGSRPIRKKKSDLNN